MNVEALAILGCMMLIAGLVLYAPFYFFTKWLKGPPTKTRRIVGTLMLAAVSGLLFYTGIHGLEVGAIPFGGKFQHALVARTDYPKLYWFVEVWTLGLASWSAWFAYRALISIVRGQPLVIRENAAQQGAPGDGPRPAGSARP